MNVIPVIITAQAVMKPLSLIRWMTKSSEGPQDSIWNASYEPLKLFLR